MYESYLLRFFTYEQNKGVLHSLIKMRTSFEYIVYAIIVHNVCNLQYVSISVYTNKQPPYFNSSPFDQVYPYYKCLLRTHIYQYITFKSHERMWRSKGQCVPRCHMTSCVSKLGQVNNNRQNNCQVPQQRHRTCHSEMSVPLYYILNTDGVR